MSSVRDTTIGPLREARAVSAGALHEALDGLDREGCAFGQVTRERLDNMLAHLQRVETTLNTIAVGVALQLLTFVFAVILFVLNHVR